MTIDPVLCYTLVAFAIVGIGAVSVSMLLATRYVSVYMHTGRPPLTQAELRYALLESQHTELAAQIQRLETTNQEQEAQLNQFLEAVKRKI